MDRGGLYVIVLNWNGEAVIGPCLESLLAVEDPPLKIIVVDNASTDSSLSILEDSFPQVTLIKNERNELFARGNNVGLRYALDKGGEAFLLLNNDTEVDPSCFREMMRALEKPDIGIVGPCILYHDDPDRIWYGGGVIGTLSGIPRHKDIRREAGARKPEGGPTAWVSGCALLVRRAVLEDIGLLDPSYHIYCEDVDFCLRARRAGWKCYYQPAARVWHKVSSSSGGGFTPFKLENRLVSTYKLFNRFRPLWWRILSFPFHILAYALLLGGLFITGRWGLFKAAWRGALRIASGR
ncbi:MAG: glycosyltransferase family 2 protein [Candidatus Krumholzibacteriota bacterium]|nr:glycosyltransferase family 2 protein [Candidatus Krumholzibacteriota bacterium]